MDLFWKNVMRIFIENIPGFGKKIGTLILVALDIPCGNFNVM
jgi:hypothetical protein